MRMKLTESFVLMSVFVAWIAVAPLQVTAQRPAMEFEFGKQRVHSVAFSPDGRFLAAGNFRGEVRVWNVADGKEVQTLTASKLEVRLLEFLAGRNTLLSVDADGEVNVWETATWKPKNNFFTVTAYAGAVSPTASSS